MDIGGIIISLLDLSWVPVAKRFSYFRNVQKHLEALHVNVEELNGRANDIKMEMDTGVAYLNKKPKSEAQLWLKHVEKVNNEVSSLENEISIKGRCMNGCFPNCCSRYKLGKRLVQKIKDVAELQGTGVFPNGLFLDLLPNGGNFMPTTGIIGETIPRKVLHEIWECLIDDNINKIGVYGMGGVGKTTIMMHINNLLNESQIFDIVIWVTSSKVFDLEKLQIDIANAVHLDLSYEQNVMRRSTLLFEHLQRMKKFTLIIDDLWSKFILEDVGIPQPNKDNGCKLVFITRLMEVCRGMETHREIKVDVFSEQEAWNLFIDKACIDGFCWGNLQIKKLLMTPDRHRTQRL